jgi:ABC-type transport system substrate-binding protein
MSISNEQFSGKPIPKIIRAAQVTPDSSARADVPYEIQPVYVMSPVIPITVYYFDEVADDAEEDQDQAATPE